MKIPSLFTILLAIILSFSTTEVSALYYKAGCFNFDCFYSTVSDPFYRCTTGAKSTAEFYVYNPDPPSGFPSPCLLYGTATYQWYEMWTGYWPCGGNMFCWDTRGRTIDGATNNMFEVTEAGTYFCMYSCGETDYISDTIQVIYHSDIPTISAPPANESTCEGTTAQFSCTNFNTSYLNWRESANGSDWTSISGENSNTLEFIADYAKNGYQYLFAATNACGTNYSAPATLSVLQEPFNISNPSATNMCEDGTANFNTSAEGDGLSYRWRVSTNGTTFEDLNEQSPHSGTQTKYLLVGPAVKAMNGYIYQCRISGTCGSDTTSRAILSLKLKPEFVAEPYDVEICEGETHTFSTIVNGEEPLEYNWRKNNTSLGGWSSASTLTINNAKLTDAASYDVIVKNECYADGIYSTDAELIVNSLPVLSLEEIETLCKGDSVDIDAGSGFLSYDWNTGETTQVINVSQSGKYRVIVANQTGCLARDCVYVSIDSVLLSIDLGEDRNYCLGDAIILDAGPDFDSYQWSDGSITQTIEVDASGLYWITASKNNTACHATDTVDIFVAEPYNQETLCIVTIDLASGKNMLVWEKTPDAGIKSYNLYRESTIDQYGLIATVPYGDLSIYVDSDVSPENRSYIYKITSVDFCDNESELDSVPYHKPIFLTYSPSEQGVALNWTNYEIQGVDRLGDFLVSYDIYRGTSISNLNYYVTVGSTTDFQDTDPLTKTTRYYYRVAGVLKDPCYPSAGKKSDQAEEFSKSLSNLEYNSDIIGLQSYLGTGLMTIYPNPMTDHAKIRFENPGNDSYRLILVDVSGKTVMIKENIRENEILIHRDGIKPGFYHVQLLGKRIYHGTLIIR